MEAKKRSGRQPMGGPSQAKRGRVGGDREGSPSLFEEELALPDEPEMEAESQEGQAGQDLIPIGNLAKERLYGRRDLGHAPPPPLQAQTDQLTFQQIDLDYYLGSPVAGMPGQSQGSAPIVRMFGVTDGGNSVCCHVHGFAPYLYVLAPAGFSSSHLSEFQKELNSAVLKDMRTNKDNLSAAVLAVDVTHKENLYGFRGIQPQDFLRITVATPRLIAAAKRLLEQGFKFGPFPAQKYATFEANIDFEIRFMVDSAVVGCCWIQLPAGRYRAREERGPGRPPRASQPR
ncbi:hypothetical protein COCON_G00202440 [Conger conger]|uniref:3'-5' exodeoxyribonuclease n=1 Tax=Conger conger TaxID=82655 RepID=A0A9Q1CZM4_CONCO|nr:hypothetical protein COCON_G00202440 [Conger conger]